MRLSGEPRATPARGRAPPAKPRVPLRRRSPLGRRMRRLAFQGGFVLALCGVLAGAWFWFYRSDPTGSRIARLQASLLGWTAAAGFVVADIQVEGRSRTSREALLHAIGAGRDTPILAVDPVRTKAQLEAIPWVRSATVERRLPDTLYIRIVERAPLALWQRQGKLVLIDRDGSVVPIYSLDAFPGLIVLVGDDAPPRGAQLLDMLAGEPELASHVAAAVRVGGRRWNLRLDSGIDVELPEDNAEAAWHQLAQLERSDSLLQRDVQAVDLRLPDRLVVRVAPDAMPKPQPVKKGRQGGKST